MKQKKDRRKIAFFGVFGNQNFGNECTLQATMQNLRPALPDAEFICLCTVPEDTGSRHCVPAFPAHQEFPAWLNTPLWSSGVLKLFRKVVFRPTLELIHWVRAFKVIRGCRMLIVPGTQVVSGYVTGPFSWPYDIFKWAVVARLRRAKLVFLSIGVGPIYHPISRWFIRTGLDMADYCSYRDIASKKYATEIGCSRPGDLVYPDLAFSFQQPLLPEDRHDGEEMPVIGIGLKDYLGPGRLRDRHRNDTYRSYLNTLADLVGWLCRRRCKVRLIIGDVLYDSSVREDFMITLRERELISQEVQIVSEPACNLEDLLSQIAAIDFLVTSRFHNIVLAFMLNKPVVCLSDHSKLECLMNEIGLGEYCLPLASLEVDDIIATLVRLEKNADSVRAYIKCRAGEYRATLEKQYASLFAELGAERTVPLPQAEAATRV
jgi:polysaccharide pyruvyl transferase WcaK-like protein